MNGASERQPRHAVSFRAHIRDAGEWHEVAICNISRRGLMLKGACVPSRGAYVEIQRGDLHIIAQVRWSAAGRCGVRTRDPVDLSEFGLGDTSKPSPVAHLSGTVVSVRRADALEIAAQSRRATQAFNLALAIAVAVGVAYLAGSAVNSALSGPAGQIRQQLSTE